MKRSVLTLALAVTSLASMSALAGVSAQAAPRTVDVNNIVNESAYATWDYVSGNIGTFVSVVSTTQLGTDPCKCVALAVAQYDTTTSNVLISGVAYTDQYTLTVDGQLGSATLHVADAIFQDDYTFTFFNVDIDLNWTATAEASNQKFHDHFKLPGMIFVSNFRGNARDAVATGTVTGKNVPNRGTLQFTPVPSSTAQLQNNTIGSVTITTGGP